MIELTLRSVARARRRFKAWSLLFEKVLRGLDSYPNVIIRAIGIASGRKSCSHIAGARVDPAEWYSQVVNALPLKP